MRKKQRPISCLSRRCDRLIADIDFHEQLALDPEEVDYLLALYNVIENRLCGRKVIAQLKQQRRNAIDLLPQPSECPSCGEQMLHPGDCLGFGHNNLELKT